jgi:hypothetical protein
LSSTAASLAHGVGELEHAVKALDDAWHKLSDKVSDRLGNSHAMSSLPRGAPPS